MAIATQATSWESLTGRLHRLAEKDPLFPSLMQALAVFCAQPDDLSNRRTVRYADEIGRRRGLPRAIVLSAAHDRLTLPWPKQASSLLH